MSPSTVPELVLASASPRRALILSTLQIDFRVLPADVDETRREGEKPTPYARRLAVSKSEAIRVALRDVGETPYVLGADTIVVVDGDVLGKPVDALESAAMLSRLSGRGHHVVTALSLMRGEEGLLEASTVSTRVRFRELSPDTIQRYAASGEGLDKAGAYGIQGLGAGLVEEIVGSYHNVMGLPASETIALLLAHGAISRWP